MVEFKSADSWAQRGGGRPMVKVPPQLTDWLIRSYKTGTYFEIPITENDILKSEEVVKMAKSAVRRRKKSLKYEIDHEAGVLRLMMRDKRVYNRRTTDTDSEGSQ